MPLVVESCIRFIITSTVSKTWALLPLAWHPILRPPALRPPAGLQHEGIFRVSGAQPRVSEIRDAFERGGDRRGWG